MWTHPPHHPKMNNLLSAFVIHLAVCSSERPRPGKSNHPHTTPRYQPTLEKLEVKWKTGRWTTFGVESRRPGKIYRWYMMLKLVFWLVKWFIRLRKWRCRADLFRFLRESRSSHPRATIHTDLAIYLPIGCSFFLGWRIRSMLGSVRWSE